MLDSIRLQEIPEFNQFLGLYSDIIKDHEILRTELSIYSRKLNIAGQIDCLCQDANGLVIWDWKRSKEIKYTAYSSMEYPLMHLPNSNFYHYALQLNLYKYILETDYKHIVSRMYLGVFHPTRSRYECIEIPSLDYEIKCIVELIT